MMVESIFLIAHMAQVDQQQNNLRTDKISEVVKFGSLGIYAEDPSQAWGVVLTFLTLFIWFVYINNDLGDQVFRSIFIVAAFGIGTLIIYRFWMMFHRRVWRRFWPR